MYGLGDNIFQRPFVKTISERKEIFIQTPWPEIYRDINGVRFIKPETRLRTQRKNIDKQLSGTWEKLSPMPFLKIGYGGKDLNNGSIFRAMRSKFKVDPVDFDLPSFSGPEIKKPYAVIRPVTVRQEWRNEARNPLPEYIWQAAQILKENGFTVISIADLKDGQEWAESLPPYDIAYHRGELDVTGLLGLIQDASVVVGGVGWIVPACIFSKVPIITVLGGQGGHNAPEKITDQSMDLKKTRWIYPDNYCRCSNMLHRCDKTIIGFAEKFTDALCSIA